ncbi:LOW QUALITY PROTEIN: hypothetical protein V2J09_005740 [Rumex salicifolius]
MDSRFTSKLWTELLKLLGIELQISTVFHPQTDGQTECINDLVLPPVLHVPTTRTRPSCLTLLSSQSIGKSPFEVALDTTPIAHQRREAEPNYKFTGDSWRQQVEVALAYLARAQKWMKKWADTKQRPSEYRVNKGLLRKYEGSFKILANVEVAHKLALPATMKTHPVVHMIMLKSYHLDQDERIPGESLRVPTLHQEDISQHGGQEEEDVVHNRVLCPLDGPSKGGGILGEGEGLVTVPKGDSQVLGRDGGR